MSTEYIIGSMTKSVGAKELFAGSMDGETVEVKGAIHALREFSDVVFLVLRQSRDLLQCVIEKADAACKLPEKTLHEETTVKITGKVREEEKAPGGREIVVTAIEILSEPKEGNMLPLAISKRKLKTSLEAKLAVRPVALRNIRERAIFKLQEGLGRAFRDFLYDNDFTEIRTPKIVAGNAEGGANVFKLEYFGKKAFLTQSPQFYKQMMVGVYGRVFEAAPVFRAEKHNTVRHLNEYTSLDLEIAYIDSFYDIMELETALLKYMFSFVSEKYKNELAILETEVPVIDKIPAVRFAEAKRLVAEKYNRKMKNPNDLEPEEEILIGKYFKEEYGSDFVFVTHYPSKKRPFYAMDDPEDKKVTLSFDLLYKGMEITTGGQRIHDYDEQVEKMQSRDMDIDDFSNYLMIHKCGMPPHGGLGMGLERLTMKLIGETNVREATMFPRDVNRLEP